MREIIGAAKAVEAKLDKCYISFKVSEKHYTYGPVDAHGRGFCQGLATALSIIRQTDAVDEWRNCESRFDPESDAFKEQEEKVLKVKNA